MNDELKTLLAHAVSAIHNFRNSLAAIEMHLGIGEDEDKQDALEDAVSALADAKAIADITHDDVQAIHAALADAPLTVEHEAVQKAA